MTIFFRVWLVLLLFPFFTHAQQDSVRVLQDVAVSSQRITKSFRETSAAVIQINQQDIQRTPAISVADVLHYQPGVDVRSRGANGIQSDISIRGGTFDQTLVLLNGIKISDMQTGHHSLNLPVDIDNVARIEVWKGPAARLYGQNAFAGAVNIITKSPEKNFVRASFLGGGNALGGIRLSGSHRNEQVSQYISASHDFSDGYRYNTAYALTNLLYQSDISHHGKKWNVMAGYTQRSFGANGFYASPSYQEQYEKIQTSVVALTFPAVQKNTFALHHRLYWRRNQDEFILNRFSPTTYRNLHINNTVGYELNASISNSLGVTGFGLDVNRVNLISSNLGNRSRHVITAFGEHRFEKNNAWDVTPGFQLNYYSDFGLNFFPGVDAGVWLNKAVKLFGNAGYTYRVPTYTDLYYSDPANRGNADLKPETAFTGELGFRFFENNVTGQVSYFQRDGRKIIDWTKTQLSDAWQVQNVSSITMEGVDTELSFPINTPILQQIKAGYTYINAWKYTPENFSKYAFDQLTHYAMASAFLTYGAFSHQISYRYAQRIYLANYQVVDTRVSWKHKNWQVFADVTNIFDTAYTETSLVPMPGRWFRTGISFSVE